MKGDSAMARTERTFYLLFGSYSLAQFFLAPVYPLLLLSRGLDLLEINLILAIYLINGLRVRGADRRAGGHHGRAAVLLRARLRDADRRVRPLLRARGFADCATFEFVTRSAPRLVSGALEAWARRRRAGRRRNGRRMEGLFSRRAVIGRMFLNVGAVGCGYLAERDLRIRGWRPPPMFAATGVAGAVLMHETGAHRGQARAPLRRPHGDRRPRARTRSPVLLSSARSRSAPPSPPSRSNVLAAALQALAGVAGGWIVALLALASPTGSALVRRRRRFARVRALRGHAVARRDGGDAGGRGEPVAGARGLLLQETAFGVSTR